jgi:hypothetical protein
VQVGLRPPDRLERGQPLDVVDVQVGQEQVDARRGLLEQREAEAARAGAGVEDDEAAVVEADLDARGVAAVAGG